MKTLNLILGLAAGSFLMGCATTTRVALAPVGPNPNAGVSQETGGKLEVYSRLQQRRDGNEYDVDPAWYQHTDYNVLDQSGRLVKHVFNTVGHYEQAPVAINLPAGEYRVVAQAQGKISVSVPVVIENGRTTRVHLDAKWAPPAGTPSGELVMGPSGYPVGWRAP